MVLQEYEWQDLETFVRILENCPDPDSLVTEEDVSLSDSGKCGLTELRSGVVLGTFSRLLETLKNMSVYSAENSVDIQGSEIIKQGILVGPILNEATGKKETVIDVETYQKLRKTYIETSTAARREILSDCEDYEEILTRAVVQYEMLYVNPSKSMTLMLKNPSEFDYAQSSALKDAISILYNRARVFGILERHKRMVQLGVLSDLPKFHELNLRILDLKEEQELIKYFILRCFPLLRQIVSSAKNGHCPTQKLPVFLVLLSRKFSLYYSSVRILTESLPRPSDLPLLQVRVVLLKCIIYVYGLMMRICGMKTLKVL